MRVPQVVALDMLPLRVDCVPPRAVEVERQLVHHRGHHFWFPELWLMGAPRQVRSHFLPRSRMRQRVLVKRHQGVVRRRSMLQKVDRKVLLVRL